MALWSILPRTLSPQTQSSPYDPEHQQYGFRSQYRPRYRGNPLTVHPERGAPRRVEGRTVPGFDWSGTQPSARINPARPDRSTRTDKERGLYQKLPSTGSGSRGFAKSSLRLAQGAGGFAKSSLRLAQGAGASPKAPFDWLREQGDSPKAPFDWLREQGLRQKLPSTGSGSRGLRQKLPSTRSGSGGFAKSSLRHAQGAGASPKAPFDTLRERGLYQKLPSTGSGSGGRPLIFFPRSGIIYLSIEIFDSHRRLSWIPKPSIASSPTCPVSCGCTSFSSA